MILLGNTYVGKTCIFDRITRGNYNDNCQATMAHTFASKLITVKKMLNARGESQELRESFHKKPNRLSRGEDTVSLIVS